MHELQHLELLDRLIFETEDIDKKLSLVTKRQEYLVAIMKHQFDTQKEANEYQLESQKEANEYHLKAQKYTLDAQKIAHK